jgi:hypothetical protein
MIQVLHFAIGCITENGKVLRRNRGNQAGNHDRGNP